MNDKIPWVEKYRPKQFNNIVLSDINKKILENIIKKNNFPNLLLYGQPGTGKTTTIINLIESYQEKYFEKFIHIIFVISWSILLNSSNSDELFSTT